MKGVEFVVHTYEYFALSFFLASVGLFLPDNKDRKESIGYFVAAIILGTVSGFTAKHTPFLADFDFLLSVLGTISGPATYAMVRRKTLIDLLRMYKTAEKGKPDTGDKNED